MTRSTETLRGPRQERSRLTRRRLLEATVDCLAEYGWAGTTVAVVAERAGVSRGAAQHHFRTREELVTAAVRQMAALRAEEIRAEVGSLPGERRTEQALQLLARYFTSPIFAAALQLWVAASTDESLRQIVAPLEAQVGRETHRFTVELLGADETRPGAREAVQATLDLLRGLGLANLLSDDTTRRTRLLHEWSRYLDTVLSDPRAS